MRRDPTITIDVNADLALYRQILDQIRLHISQATLQPGDPLPSVRSLATQLGVHFNTVAEAYRELAEEGWITLAQGRRATVRPLRPSARTDRAEADSLVQRLRHLLAEMRLKGIADTRIEIEVEAVLRRQS